MQTTKRRTTTSTAVSFLTLLMASAPALADSTAKQRPLIAESCIGCHGDGGSGEGGVPSIRGYDRADFVRVWSQFRANERPATIMGRIARGYNDAEVAALADYFSSLK